VAAFLRAEGYEPVWKDWDATYDGLDAGRVVPVPPSPALREAAR